MQQRWCRSFPVLLVFGVLLVFITVAPQTVGASGVSARGGVNPDGSKAFVLDGNGFAPGEKITVTGLLPDGSTAAFPDITSNAIGAFSVAVPYNPSVFRIRVTGQLTGITALTDVGPVFGTPPGFAPPGPCASYYYAGYFCGLGYPGYYPGYYGYYPW